MLDAKLLELAEAHFTDGVAFMTVMLREPSQFRGWDYPAFNMYGREVRQRMDLHGCGAYHADMTYPYSLFWMVKGPADEIGPTAKGEFRKLFEFAVSLFDSLGDFNDGKETFQNLTIGNGVTTPVPVVSSKNESIVVCGIEILIESSI